MPAPAQGDILYRNATAWVRLPAGTSGDVLTTGGAGANPSWQTPSGVQTVQIFDTAGNHSYVTPAGATLLIVECVGGGGGGGGVDQAATNSAAGGGGGAGGYARTYITNPDSDYDIVVGAHGPGGAPGLNNGSPGEDSIFREDGGGTILCNGKGGRGGGGNQVATVPHIGGFGARGGGDPADGANVGDISIVGAPGDYGVCLAAAQAFSGTGGSSIFGGGGQGKSAPTGGGVNAPGFGGGGSGGCILSGGADQSGGNGAAGIVIVTEFY